MNGIIKKQNSTKERIQQQQQQQQHYSHRSETQHWRSNTHQIHVVVAVLTLRITHSLNVKLSWIVDFTQSVSLVRVFCTATAAATATATTDGTSKWQQQQRQRLTSALALVHNLQLSGTGVRSHSFSYWQLFSLYGCGYIHRVESVFCISFFRYRNRRNRCRLHHLVTLLCKKVLCMWIGVLIFFGSCKILSCVCQIAYWKSLKDFFFHIENCSLFFFLTRWFCIYRYSSAPSYGSYHQHHITPRQC